MLMGYPNGRVHLQCTWIVISPACTMVIEMSTTWYMYNTNLIGLTYEVELYMFCSESLISRELQHAHEC